jgi:hypothetical protein
MNYPYPSQNQNPYNPIVPSQKQIHEFKKNEKYRNEQRIHIVMNNEFRITLLK